MSRIKILDIYIDDINLDNAADLVIGWLNGNSQKYIVTPNPEFLVVAQTDPDFKKILNEANLAIPDGIGLKIASPKLKNRLTGVDLMLRLSKLCEEKGFTIGLFGGGKNVAKETAECLVKKFPKIKINSISDGLEVTMDGKIKNSPEIALKTLIKPCDILFVALGQVKQEKFIARNLDKLPVKVAMGVGGAFDYISGRVPRSPFFIRQIGFEWLFRLILQPSRIKRQINLLKFLWMTMLK